MSYLKYSSFISVYSFSTSGRILLLLLLQYFKERQVVRKNFQFLLFVYQQLDLVLTGKSNSPGFNHFSCTEFMLLQLLSGFIVVHFEGRMQGCQEISIKRKEESIIRVRLHARVSVLPIFLEKVLCTALPFVRPIVSYLGKNN